MSKKLMEALKKGAELLEMDVKKFENALETETKADEVMNTGATGFGAELIPATEMLDPMLDAVPTYSNLISVLPWNHGTNLGKSVELPIVGEAELFAWNSEWTTWAASLWSTPADKWPSTGKVTITQGMYIAQVAISKRELNYSPVQLETLVKERLNKSAARTIDAVILNGDSATSWNVNFSGWTPASTSYYLQNTTWVRKVWLANSTDIGTLASADFITMLGTLDAWYQADLNNLLFIMPANVYNKAVLLDEVLTADKFGPNATILSWVLAKIFGIDIMIQRDFPALALDTWLVHATTGNTFGSMALIYKPAVQFGFGQALEIETVNNPWRGIILIATFEFGVAIADQVSGLGKSIATWVNIAV